MCKLCAKLSKYCTFLCKEKGCIKAPSYGYKNKKTRLYCAEHKKKHMIDVNHKRCLECNKIACFSYVGQNKRLYCREHKKEDMVNPSIKSCKSEWCTTNANSKYNGYCLFCYINLFPETPKACMYKTKEQTVVDFVKTKFANFEWVHNHIINGGCSKRRPDIFLDLGYQVIIIEIDENQHYCYDSICENKRIMELSQDVAHRPIVFIRFNPDDYLQKGKKVTSCWGRNTKGICVVKNTKRNEWNTRLGKLEESIIYWTNPTNVSNKTIETIKLFYDVI
jgi:hypothetical protein